MLQVFSDAGQWQDFCFTAFLIFEDWDEHLTFTCEQHHNVGSCAEGELLGVKGGLEWVVNNRPDAKELSLYIDNLSIAQKLSNYVETGIKKQGAYPFLWSQVYDLCDHFDSMTIYHIPAHQSEHNPNKACDILCSSLLRPYKEAFYVRSSSAGS